MAVGTIVTRQLPRPTISPLQQRSAMVVICAECGRVCMGQDVWVEVALPEGARVTRVLCPDCFHQASHQWDNAAPDMEDELD